MTAPRHATRHRTLWSVLRERLRRNVSDVRDRGASAIEFAIIAAVVVVAASVVGGVVYGIVSNKSDQLKACSEQAIGATSCGVSGGTAPASP